MQVVRDPRQSAVVVGIVMALLVGYLVGVAHAADSKLALADASLEKAIVLLQSAETGEVDAKTARTAQRHIDRAITDAERARAQVAKAIQAIDGTAP